MRTQSLHQALTAIVGESEAILELRNQLLLLADLPLSVLILGESGTGKELCAAVFRAGTHPRPFVAVNCATLSPELSDSQLFGHTRGAFTGAVNDQAGLIQEAHKGTLFLDEFAELPLPVQAKLLRVLESGEYRPVGGTPKVANIRLIAATNEDPEHLVSSARLRRDILHRVGAATVIVPPLRDRRSDIPLLCNALLQGMERTSSRPARSLTPRALAHVIEWDWPGNVRQLKNVLEAAAAYAGTDSLIRLEHIRRAMPPLNGDQPRPGVTYKQATSRAAAAAITSALTYTHGDRDEAARQLEISTSTLYRKIASLGVVCPPTPKSENAGPRRSQS